MNILIIGCYGFIGSHLYQYFSDKKYKVTGADIVQFNGENFLLNNDLSNLKLLLGSKKIDICINASGSATVGFSMQNQDQDYILNYKNVEIIINELLKYQPHCRFINLSSAAVYGNPEIYPIKENAPTNPISPYGKHKLMSEELLKKAAHKYKLKALSLRVFSVYGIGLKKQLFWDIYEKSKQDKQINLFGTGNETRDFIYIHDLMQALEKVILYANFDGSAINVASGKEITIIEAASKFISFLNPNLTLNFTGVSNQADPKFWKADITKLSKTGFKAKTDINNGLKEYASWLQELS
jgi:dTDP-glucose 4,6-dehydratase/UDP-glucose 4-epimerase